MGKRKGSGSLKGGVLFASAIILSGCGSGAAKAPSSAPPSHSAAKSQSATKSASASASSAKAPSSSGTLQTVTIGTPDASDLALIELYLARDLGIFKQYGIRPQFEVMHPPEAIAALANGNLDFMTPVDATATAHEKGLPLQIVGVVEDNAEFLLLGAKGMTSISDLKGHTVITGSRKGNANFLMIVDALKQAGLPPGSYKTDFANAKVTVALLNNHQAAAGMETEPVGLQLKQMGYPLLLNLMSVKIPGIGIGTSTAIMQKHPQLVRNFLKAMLAATKVLATDKSKVLPYLEKDFHLSPSIASQVYDLNHGHWILSGRASLTAEQNMMNFDQKELKLKAPPDPGKIFNYSFLPPVSASPSP